MVRVDNAVDVGCVVVFTVGADELMLVVVCVELDTVVVTGVKLVVDV